MDKVTFHYDQEVDVLYVTIGEKQKAGYFESDKLDFAVRLTDNNKIVGFLFTDFVKKLIKQYREVKND